MVRSTQDCDSCGAGSNPAVPNFNSRTIALNLTRPELSALKPTALPVRGEVPITSVLVPVLRFIKL